MKALIKKEILNADFIAIADDKGNKITYKALLNEAEILSAYIEERSIVFILCDHHIETVKFLYEVFCINRIPLLLSSDINEELFIKLIEKYKPNYIYCKNKYKIKKYNFIKKIKLDNHILFKTGTKKHKVSPDLALLLSTSGTTGSEKLVKLSYDNLLDNIKHASQKLNVKSGQKGITPLPLNHIYGLDFCFWHWYCGATLMITEESILSNKFQEFYVNQKINNFAATPYVYKILHKIRFWDANKIENLHFAMSAGEQMSRDDQKELVSIMENKFWISYGQTECSYMITAMNFEKENMKLGSVGKALENMELTIDNKSGELIVKSKSVCMGYTNCIAQLAKGDENHGIIHTGDQVYVDNDGCIYLRGRLTRYVKVLGKRVCLDDVERYLEENYRNLDVACIGVDNQIIIFYTNFEAILEKEIPMLLDRVMRIPHKFISCNYLIEIPRSDTGKIRYAELEEIGNERKSIKNM